MKNAKVLWQLINQDTGQRSEPGASTISELQSSLRARLADIHVKIIETESKISSHVSIPNVHTNYLSELNSTLEFLQNNHHWMQNNFVLLISDDLSDDWDISLCPLMRVSQFIELPVEV